MVSLVAGRQVFPLSARRVRNQEVPNLSAPSLVSASSPFDCESHESGLAVGSWQARVDRRRDLSDVQIQLCEEGTVPPPSCAINPSSITFASPTEIEVA